MIKELGNIIEKVKNDKTLLSSNEANTRTIINDILRILGWNVSDINEFIKEYKTPVGRVDIALYLDKYNKIFIEAKRAGLQLQQEHQEKLDDYAVSDGNVSISILTNAIRWWFYLSKKDGSIEQKKFCLIDIEHQEVQEIAERFVYFLLKENVKSGQAKKLADEIHARKRNVLNEIEDALPQAWNKLVSDIGEELVCLIMDKTENICSHKPDVEMIEKFIEENKVQFLIPNIVLGRDNIDYTGYIIKTFYFKNQIYSVNRWKDFLVQLSNVLYVNHGRDFFDKVKDYRGYRYAYFSQNKNELKFPEKIGGSDIYVETGFSANRTVEFCERLVEIFGYPKSVLRIDAYRRT
jgi:hypothetical protein